MGIRNFLTPKPDPDPLAKNTGFGWGWFVLIGYLGSGFSRVSSLPPDAKVLIEIICLSIIAIIYFVIRKRIIEKRRYGNSIRIASFVAGIWSFLFGLLLLFLVSLLFLVTIRNTNNEKALKELNTLGLAIVSTAEGLPPEEIEHILKVRDQANEIYRKYLTPDEYTQVISIALNVTNGIATADNIKWARFYEMKVRSLSSSMEKETLDELSRLTQKLRSIKK